MLWKRCNISQCGRERFNQYLVPIDISCRSSPYGQVWCKSTTDIPIECYLPQVLCNLTSALHMILFLWIRTQLQGLDHPLSNQKISWTVFKEWGYWLHRKWLMTSVPRSLASYEGVWYMILAFSGMVSFYLFHIDRSLTNLWNCCVDQATFVP